MRKKILLINLTLITILSLQAQNELDALRYTQHNIFGNARFTAMSGAFGALGGEFSALSYNPAGIGMYQFNEITFTPIFNLSNTKSYFNSTQIEDDKIGLSIGTAGGVFSRPLSNKSWKRINFGIGINQLASYNRNIIIEGENNTSSLADKMLELAQGNTIEELNYFHTDLAFWTDLIDLADNTIDTSVTPNWYLNDNGNYISNIKSNGNKLQYKNIRTEGSEHDFILSFGSSYEEKLYLGVTIGFPSINYYEVSNYTEDVLEDTINGLKGFSYQEELSTSGSGINIKTGMLVRISERLKLGTSLHSPTYYSFEETYSTSLSTYFSGDNFSENSPYNYFEYELFTPWKAMISISTSLNKSILINADYEIVDFSFSKMSSSMYDFRQENQAIKDMYQQTNNIRVGTEINIKPFVLRGGYSKYGSPYIEKDFSKENYSFGIGIYNGGYSFDVAYILSQQKGEYNLYSNDYINPISLFKTDHNIVITLGLRY